MNATAAVFVRNSPPSEFPVFVGADQVASICDWPRLMAALHSGFASGAEVPQRHHHSIGVAGTAVSNTLLLMPAWRNNGTLGVKQVMICPENGLRGLPAVSAFYFLGDALTGRPRAIIDGGELTARRTAATSTLAARFLSRPESSKLLIVGTGRIASHLVHAYQSARPITEIAVWGRNRDKVKAFVAEHSKISRAILRISEDLSEDAAWADIISCATLSRDPVIDGTWLRNGTHLDLIGGFTPEMRETDDIAISRSRVFVDALDGAPKEAGDIVIPLRNGSLMLEDIQGDLFALCRGQCLGRTSSTEITLFKSAGHAIEDLAAAELIAQELNI